MADQSDVFQPREGKIQRQCKEKQRYECGTKQAGIRTRAKIRVEAQICELFRSSDSPVASINAKTCRGIYRRYKSEESSRGFSGDAPPSLPPSRPHPSPLFSASSLLRRHRLRVKTWSTVCKRYWRETPRRWRGIQRRRSDGGGEHAHARVYSGMVLTFFPSPLETFIFRFRFWRRKIDRS